MSENQERFYEERVRELEAQLLAKDAETLRLQKEVDRLQEQLRQTLDLSTANQRLELANVSIKQQSELMLEHFACMSHEIR